MLLALGFDVLWLYFVGTSVQLHTHLVVSTSVFLIDRKINLVTKSHGDVWCICFTSSLTDHSGPCRALLYMGCCGLARGTRYMHREEGAEAGGRAPSTGRSSSSKRSNNQQPVKVVNAEHRCFCGGSYTKQKRSKGKTKAKLKKLVCCISQTVFPSCFLGARKLEVLFFPCPWRCTP